jgi:hypothetical protein
VRGQKNEFHALEKIYNYFPQSSIEEIDNLHQLENMCSFLFSLSSPVKCQKIVVVVLISFDLLSQTFDWTRFANFKANGPFIPRFR